MPWTKWLPWRFLVGRAAREHGFLDPVELIARLHRFAQPSEVAVPLELLRAAMVFHARGLINSRVIQHNLDWVWPYWVERQFDPGDVSFIPRAFTISHVNLTHRNWTAVGLPDVADLAIIDPCGLLTPFLDGWSVDCWVMTEDGRFLLPSRLRAVSQRQESGDLAVVTECASDGLQLRSRVACEADAAGPVCVLRIEARADSPGWAIVSLRPCNPEGISFIQEVGLSRDRRGWTIDGSRRVIFDVPVDRHHVSNYRGGDVFIRLRERSEQSEGHCDVGMITAAAMFAMEPNAMRVITARVPLQGEGPRSSSFASWSDSLRDHCRLRLADEKFQSLYDAALRTLILHSPGDVYPGPYTYKRFWFRDAAFIIHALSCAGLLERAERALDRFSRRQDAHGYFHSQEGEWDSNGQALWIMHRFCTMTGRAAKPEWLTPIEKAARWLKEKRLHAADTPHAGLLPAGFSAEHLGPNDYYYWDDFWGIAGLRAAADMLEPFDREAASKYRQEADRFFGDVEASLERAERRLARPAMPASPYRRLDAGAIGSIAAGYPLQLFTATDPRLIDTVEFLLCKCFMDCAFFQDVVHSGINPYLTLHVAQVLLRARDPRYLDLMDGVARLASPTGHWPEAIHPRTRGGCMGDGQHVWAAAEWVLMLRNCFVREEGDRLILCSGAAREWLRSRRPVLFGPAPTSFGTVTVKIEPGDSALRIHWEGRWHAGPPVIEVHLPGQAPIPCQPGQGSILLTWDRVP
jgi:hypothetical protein